MTNLAITGPLGGPMMGGLPNFNLAPLRQGAQAVLDALDAGTDLATLQNNPAAVLYQRLISAGRAPEQVRMLLQGLAGQGPQQRTPGQGGWGGPGGVNPNSENTYVASRPTPPGTTANFWPTGSTARDNPNFWPTGTPPSGMTLAQRVAGATANTNLAARQARLRQMLGGSAAQAGIRSVMGG
jgi:hypothetical protein